MRPNTSISPKCPSDALEIWLTSLCQQLALWVWGQIGCLSHSPDTILFFFKKSLVPLSDTSLLPPSLKGLVSYQNSGSLKPVEGFLQHGTVILPSAFTAISSFFSLQVYTKHSVQNAEAPKHSS